jgi:hypothetical protein
MTDFKRWIYHETKQPKIIYDSKYEEFKALGWADTPAAFLKLSTVGIDKEKVDDGDEQEVAKAQQALEAVDGVVRSLNGSLNIDKMSKKEIEEHIKEHFDIDLDRRKSLKNLKAEALEIIGG